MPTLSATRRGPRAVGAQVRARRRRPSAGCQGTRASAGQRAAHGAIRPGAARVVDGRERAPAPIPDAASMSAHPTPAASDRAARCPTPSRGSRRAAGEPREEILGEAAPDGGAREDLGPALAQPGELARGRTWRAAARRCARGWRASSSAAERGRRGAALRVSAQVMTGVSGRPAASSASRLCQNTEAPTAAISAGARARSRRGSRRPRRPPRPRRASASNSTPPSGVVRGS